MSDLRIVLLGKTGEGKSSCGNTILGEKVFKTGNSPNSLTHKCEARTKSISGRKITVVDAPGFFDTSVPQEKINVEIIRCITECAPGPHAFLVVLKVGRYTEHEKDTVREITRSFGEEALKHAVVLFTRGDELDEDQTIEDFVGQNTELQEFVKKCGGRVHVVDNKNWNQQQHGDKSNKVQVQNLLKTIDKMVTENGGKPYSNDMLKMVKTAIDDSNKQGVFESLCVRLVGMGTGLLVGAFLGGAIGIACVLTISTHLSGLARLGVVPTVVSTAAPIGVSTGAITAAKFAVATPAVVGGLAGLIIGYETGEKAKSMRDAMNLAVEETYETALNIKRKIIQTINDK